MAPESIAQGDLKEQAKVMLEKGKYQQARDIYYSFSDNKKEYFLNRGICNYYTSHLDEALDDLSVAFEMGLESGTLLRYLALTHHKRSEYYEAARAYKLYLNEIDRNDPERQEIIHAIKNCNYGRKAKYREQVGFVENLGQVVNSSYDEVSVVRSPNIDTKYYFSSNRKGSTGGLRNEEGLKDDIYGSYAFDIYAVEQVNGSWTPAKGVPPLLNSARDEYIQGFKENGKLLIFLKSGQGQNSEFLSDSFTLDLNTAPVTLFTPANPDLGDKDLFFINDSTFLFSSKRDGGYGGYDVYLSKKESGLWIDPINLGPEVNSPYDEVTPFLTNSGTLLYFSSNRKESLGGYDIFYSNYGIERGKWMPAENIGIPISSAGNDMYLSLSNDGRSAMFSSDRAESSGGYDLFVAYFKNQVYEQLTYDSSLPFISTYSDMTKNTSVETKSETEIPIASGKIREIVISPLFYGVDDVLSSRNNDKMLKDLLDMMFIFPSMKAVFTGHTNKGGSDAYDLYFSIKRAEQVSQYFISNGISKDRMVVYGAGSKYPMVKNIGTNMANKNNNRIEIELTTQPQEGLITSYVYPAINEYLKDDRADNFRDAMNQLTFRVAVANVNQMYDNPSILNLEDVIIEKNTINNTYTYSVGICTKYKEALVIKNHLISEGFPNVTMKVFMKGYELSIEELQLLEGENPDIAEFIQNEIR